MPAQSRSVLPTARTNAPLGQPQQISPGTTSQISPADQEKVSQHKLHVFVVTCHMFCQIFNLVKIKLKAALIMQVLQLKDEQIAMLPPEQRQSILILKEQIAQSAGGILPI
jgi:hypothetical protein